ncbi:(2Fe-2S) ferredoxin domain-containing protein [Candidatus Woesearchaeota archaeon]|nr:(2Fe-2S) ferredoxin domain-containing protein [Candidatus Woesearchaeota archaeon]
MEQIELKYKRHIFVCINERDEGESCGRKEGHEILRILREHINSKGLMGLFNVTKTKCLGHCNFGPTIAIYPEGIIFRKVSLEDTKKIINDYLTI